MDKKHVVPALGSSDRSGYMKSVRTLSSLTICLALFSAGCATKETTPALAPEKSAAIKKETERKPAPTKKESVNFSKSIRPILSNKCTICHNTEVLPKRPNFETREGVMKSGVIVPGKPDESLILSVITEDPSAEKAMPPVSHRLTEEDITLLRRWISEGADWPAGEAGRVKPAFIPEE